MKSLFVLQTIIIFSFSLLPISVLAEVGEQSNAVAGKTSNRFTGGPFKTTEKKFFNVAVISPTSVFKVGKNHADLIIHDRNGAGVVNAKLTITLWMPDMGHGSPEEPVITEKGGGLYSAENIFFNMGGYWELRIKIIKDSIEDTVVFTFHGVKEE